MAAVIKADSGPWGAEGNFFIQTCQRYDFPETAKWDEAPGVRRRSRVGEGGEDRVAELSCGFSRGSGQKIRGESWKENVRLGRPC